MRMRKLSAYKKWDTLLLLIKILIFLLLAGRHFCLAMV
jgi:hypothetical protein